MDQGQDALGEALRAVLIQQETSYEVMNKENSSFYKVTLSILARKMTKL